MMMALQHSNESPCVASVKRQRVETESPSGSSSSSSSSLSSSDELAFVARSSPFSHEYARRVAHLHAEIDALAAMPRASSSELATLQRHLMRTVVREWFERSYRVVRVGDPGGAIVRRSDLLAELNTLLHSRALPRIKRSDPLWTEWFLRDLVGLDEAHLCTGKPVRLVPLALAISVATK